MKLIARRVIVVTTALWACACGPSRAPRPAVDAGAPTSSDGTPDPREMNGNAGDGGGGDAAGGGVAGAAGTTDLRRETDERDGGQGTVTSIAAARAARPFPVRAQLSGVVVTAVWSNAAATSGGCAEATPRGWYASFWVADPSRPTDAIFVRKHCSDSPGDLQVAVGDVVDLDGFVGREKGFVEREGYRIVLKSEYDFLPAAARPGLPLVVTKRGTVAPLEDVPVPEGFGDARGGAARAGATYAGVRVRIPGPLQLVEPRPAALQRVGGDGGTPVYFGFELTGGVLVNDFKTYRRPGADAGAGCDWRAVATDGGVVTFPDGVRGIWDTYTHAPCENGGTASSCRRQEGSIPGAADVDFTFVLYPMDCATDLRSE